MAVLTSALLSSERVRYKFTVTAVMGGLPESSLDSFQPSFDGIEELGQGCIGFGL